MVDLFKELLPAIMQAKKDVIQSEEDEKDYKGHAFMVNRGLSYHQDCILYANEMNINHHLDGKLQFHFLLNTVRQMKRKYQPWQKVQKDKDLDAVKEYFGFSNEKAKEALRVLNDEQITLIKEKINKGGVTK
jgi:Bacteriophage clamp loader A subunit